MEIRRITIPEVHPTAHIIAQIVEHVAERSKYDSVYEFWGDVIIYEKFNQGKYTAEINAVIEFTDRHKEGMGRFIKIRANDGRYDVESLITGAVFSLSPVHLRSLLETLKCIEYIIDNPDVDVVPPDQPKLRPWWDDFDGDEIKIIPMNQLDPKGNN